MFKVGDIVKHKSSFLKSIGWYMDVPIDGKVMSIDERIGWPRVQWCDDDRSMLINPANIMMANEPDYSNM
jgi:hypothetical protein